MPHNQAQKRTIRKIHTSTQSPDHPTFNSSWPIPQLSDQSPAIHVVYPIPHSSIPCCTPTQPHSHSKLLTKCNNKTVQIAKTVTHDKHSATGPTVHWSKVTLVDRRVEMRRKEGRLLGLWCQHAFMILATMGGQSRGTGSR